jgi:hypothetical protein
LEDTLKDEAQLQGWTGGVKVIKLDEVNPITALEKGELRLGKNHPITAM